MNSGLRGELTHLPVWGVIDAEQAEAGIRTLLAVTGEAFGRLETEHTASYPLDLDLGGGDLTGDPGAADDDRITGPEAGQEERLRRLEEPPDAREAPPGRLNSRRSSLKPRLVRGFSCAIPFRCGPHRVERGVGDEALTTTHPLGK